MEAGFVTRVAHDLNNALAVIQGYVETIMEEVGDASPVRGDLDVILRATGRASALVSQLVVPDDHHPLESDRSEQQPPAPRSPLADGR